SFTVSASNTTASNADYNSAAFSIPQPFTIAPGAGDGAIFTTSLTATADNLVELDENLTLKLNVTSGPIGLGSGSAAEVTIVDADKAVFTISNDMKPEATGALTFTVSLSTPIDNAAAAVNITFSDVSTSAGDFTHTGQQVIFAAGDTAPKIITVV